MLPETRLGKSKPRVGEIQEDSTGQYQQKGKKENDADKRRKLENARRTQKEESSSKGSNSKTGKEA